MRTTEAVIFDMDGLLIDTEPIWRRVEIETFDRLGLHLTEEQCMETMGVRVFDVVRLWYGRHPWTGPSCEEVTEQIIDGVIDHVRREGRPMPGVLRALSMVHDAGLPMAVASSSGVKMIEAVLNRLGIEGYVRAIASADDEEAGKPDPAVYLAAARKVGAEPEACVAVEDSPNGVLAAKAAGMYCILVPDPHLQDDPRMEAADLRLSSMEDFNLDVLPGGARLASP